MTIAAIPNAALRWKLPQPASVDSTRPAAARAGSSQEARSRRWRTSNTWWSANHPVNASVSAGVFTRIGFWAGPASAPGIALAADECLQHRPARGADGSVATDYGLMPTSSSNFCNLWIRWERGRVSSLRVRVRSRNGQIGSGGTDDRRVQDSNALTYRLISRSSGASTPPSRTRDARDPSVAAAQ